MIIDHLRRKAKPVAALLIMGVCYWCTRLPAISDAQQHKLATRFQFTSLDLPQVDGREARKIRPVHPSLDHVAAWISSVGASVALTDIDQDGLSNDVCYVDTRTDQVIVASVPGQNPRYQPFTLDPGAALFDRATMAPMGCLPGDLNEDGLTDVLVYYWGRPPIAFLRQIIDTSNPAVVTAGQFVPVEIAPRLQRWYTNAITRADVDGDGHLDLIIGNYFADGARILDTQSDEPQQMQQSMSRAFNGGTNRILLFAHASGGKHPTISFREAVGALPNDVARAWTLAVGAADLDGDMLPEIYFANDFGPDRLLHNRSQPGELVFELLEGKKGFTTPNSKIVGRDSFKGMGVDFGDLNGDGLLDIYVSNIAAQFSLEESHFAFISTGEIDLMSQGVAPFVERSEQLGLSRSGWGWETRLADFDNDGTLEAIQATGFVKGKVDRWPQMHELAMSNDNRISDPRSWFKLKLGDDLSGHQHNPFFVRAADNRFYDIAAKLGIDQLQVTRGIATADVDGDGDLDFAVANQWETSRLYRNDGKSLGRSIVLRLVLPVGDHSHQKNAGGGITVIQDDPGDDSEAGAKAKPYTPAVGAQATLLLGDDQKLVAQVDGGNGHSGARSAELHFGLGDVSAEKAFVIELRWRSLRGLLHRKTILLKPGRYTLRLGE